MPTYYYTARDERGAAVNGTLAAPDSEALADQLKRMGYLVTRFREASSEVSIEGWLQRARGVGADDLVLFNVQLATMVQVGIPLVTALQTLSQQTPHPLLRLAVSDVAKHVEGGTAFSEALKRHPRIFSPLFISMVRAGEVSGKLDAILRRLAAFAKHQADLRQQLRTALTYPALLVTVGVGASAFLVTGIVPKFVAIFVEAGVELPLPTRLLYGANLLLRQYWWAVAAVLAGITAGVETLRRTPSGRARMDAALLKAPVIGDVARKTAVSRLARTLESLLSSGVPVLESLEIARETCGNAVIADACEAAQQSVREGGTMSDPLRASGEFPPMVVQMIAAGEASGTVDQMLGEIATYYDEMIRHGIKRMTALIEPVFLLLMGGLVAFIMASVLLPLFRMVNVIK